MTGPLDRRTEDARLELVLAAVNAGRSITMRARGGSMRPNIGDGDIIELLPAPSGPLKMGTVVAIKTSGAFFVHRVRGVRPDGAVLTKGDSLPCPDGWYPRAQVVALVARVDRGAGFVDVEDAPASRLRQLMGGAHPRLRRLLRRLAPITSPAR